jgi:hypothetical protein
MLPPLHRFPGEQRTHGLAGSLLVLLLVALWPSRARAEHLVTFDVPRQGAAYTIKVHPDLITVLHFPAEVEIAYCIQKPAPALVERHPRAVAIQMKPGVQHASVNVVTRAFPVAVLAEVVERPEDAHLMVQFRDVDLEREFESRVRLEVERQMLHQEAALEKERGQLEQDRLRFHDVVDEAVLARVAQGIRVQHRVTHVDERTRRGHAVLRVERVVWIGRNAYLVFSLQNRAVRPYRLEAVTLYVAGSEQASVVSFPDGERAVGRGIAGVVPARAQHTGVVVLRDAERWIGETVSVHAVEEHQKGTARNPSLAVSFLLQK